MYLKLSYSQKGRVTCESFSTLTISPFHFGFSIGLKTIAKFDSYEVFLSMIGSGLEPRTNHSFKTWMFCFHFSTSRTQVRTFYCHLRRRVGSIEERS